ncbi:MAG: hypothetical protein IPI60_06185 [Saprospiraceae bacterium]|nr:hypothetical protein [Saprospiraceae bacterium]
MRDCWFSTGLVSGSFDACGGMQTITWTFTDACDRTITHTQTITVEPAAQAAFINAPADVTMTCEEAAVFTVSDLAYTNGETGSCEIAGSAPGLVSGSFDACGGTQTITWTFTDACDRTITHTQTITVEPAPQAAFINAPADITLTCEEASVFTVSDLAYTNGESGSCDITGTVPGLVSGSFDACGGTQTITWSFTDVCDRTITHTQTITIEPAAVATFINAPADITLTCEEGQNFVVSSLDYSNGMSGSCEITGSVPGILSGIFDVCGSVETVTWTFTDDCGRIISHIQTITTLPAPEPVFINAPADITLTCEDASVFTVSDLAYTNGETGSCEVTGTVPGLVSGSFDACGGVQTITWTFVDDCNRTITHTQTITVEPAPQAAFINAPADITLTCEEASIFTASDLNYANGETGSCEITGTVPGLVSGSFDACGGTQTITWTFTDACDRTITHTQTITVEPAPQAAFINAPADVTMTCEEAAVFTVSDLAYTNGEAGSCEIAGSVPGLVSGSFDACGGTQTITWTFTDACDRTITHTQTITVEPAPQAAFINAPADVTMTCEEAAVFTVSDLAYTNGEAGSCEIAGSAPGLVSGSFDACGGTQTITWTFTDTCDRTITHTQTITVEPAAPAAFINAPADVTMTCEEAAVFTASDLNYTNGETGSCEIAGSVPGLVSGSFDACGGTQTITWTFTDACDRTITHTQTITVEPAPQAAFINAPADVTMTCEEAAVFTVSDLNYTNGETGSCEITGTVPGLVSGGFDACGGIQTITWIFTDACDRTITHTQTITVEPALQAAFVNAPADITLTCDEAAVFTMLDLDYSNGATGSCEITGSVPGVLNGSFDTCGGTQTITWTFTDMCDRTIMHVQTINVIPALEAAFINPPADIILTCEEATNMTVSTLNYTNAELGSCEITGSVPGLVGGNFDECGGILTITWTFTDECDRTISHTQTITVEPAAQASFINAPADIILNCLEAVSFSVPDLSYSNGENGSCDISGFIPGILSGTFDECGGTQTITWTFTDPCGRVISHVQNVSIEPTSAASFVNPPADITLTCEEAANFVPGSLNYSNDETTLCDISGSVPGILSGDLTACGTGASVTWTFVDICGRDITHVQMINVIDDIAPIITCPVDLSHQCIADLPAPYSSLDEFINAGGTVSDNCNLDSISFTFVSENLTGNCPTVVTRVYSILDHCLNVTTCTQVISILDTIPPVFLDIPVDETISCEETIPAIPILQASDNCGQTDVTVAEIIVPGTCDNEFTIVRTFTATDICGNTTTLVQTITVTDEILPVFTFVPADIDLGCNEDIVYEPATATDNCGDVVISEVRDSIPGICEGSFVIIRTFTATDLCGNTATAIQTIGSGDDAPPEFTFIPADYAIACDDPVVFEDPQAVDLCGMVTITEERDTFPGDCLFNFDIQRTFVASDGCGNTTSAIQRIEIRDTLAPLFNFVPASYTASCEDNLIFEDATGIDNCSTVEIVETRDTIPGVCENSFQIIRIFTATDLCGNSRTATQIIDVDDTDSPTITCVGSSEVQCLTDVPPVFTSLVDFINNGGSVSDNCGLDSISFVLISENITGTCPTIVSRVYGISDQCLNLSTCSQVITVLDTIPPIFLDSPANITVQCLELVPEMPELPWTDNCGTAGNATGSETSDGQTNPETITRTWTIADDCGNESIIAQSIIVTGVEENFVVAEICEGDTLLFNGNPVYEPGIYVDTLQTSLGCDSIENLTLIVHPIFTNDIIAEICDGESYDFNGTLLTIGGLYTDTLQTAFGCDSIENLTLTVHPIFSSDITAEICEGETYNFNGTLLTIGGIYSDSLQTIFGCDSIENLNLIVHPAFNNDILIEICEGDTYNFNGTILNAEGSYIDTLQTAFGCDSIENLTLMVLPIFVNDLTIDICEGQTYDFNGNIISTAGFYTDTLLSNFGCDSILNLTLSVHPNFSVQIDHEICEGQTYDFNGVILDMTGTYTDSLNSVNGCDSIVTLNLTVSPVLEETISAEICQGAEYDFNGQILTVAGTYSTDLTNANGCDSIVTLILTVLPALEETIAVDICQGVTYDFNGQLLNISGTYTAQLTNSEGCDSIVTLILMVNPPLEETISAEICQGAVYDFNGQLLTASGIYVADLVNSEGCDSIVTLNLTVNPAFEETITAEICQGATYDFNGQMLTVSGTYTTDLTNAQGCDSIVTLLLTVNPALEETITAEICQGVTYNFNGQTLTVGGTYTSDVTTAEGCDSIVTLILTVLPALEETITADICQGASYDFNGQMLTIGGTYTSDLTNAEGCDSIVTLILTVSPALQETISAEICQGAIFDFNGQQLTASGTYTSTITTAEGCDSTITLLLTVNPALEETITAEICRGSTFDFNGQLLIVSGTYTSDQTTAEGCDSIVTLILTVSPALEETITAEICQGATYDFNGQIITNSGTYVADLTTAEGCDSIVTLILTVSPALEETITAEICQGTTFDFNGQILTVSGTYTSDLSTSNGCDSIVTLILTVNPALEETITAEICQGATYDFNGQQLTDAGVYIADLTNAQGCDSIVTLVLTVAPILVETITAEICQGRIPI